MLLLLVWFVIFTPGFSLSELQDVASNTTAVPDATTPSLNSSTTSVTAMIFTSTFRPIVKNEAAIIRSVTQPGATGKLLNQGSGIVGLTLLRTPISDPKRRKRNYGRLRGIGKRQFGGMGGFGGGMEGFGGMGGGFGRGGFGGGGFGGGPAILDSMSVTDSIGGGGFGGFGGGGILDSFSMTDPFGGEGFGGGGFGGGDFGGGGFGGGGGGFGDF